MASSSSGPFSSARRQACEPSASREHSLPHASQTRSRVEPCPVGFTHGADARSRRVDLRSALSALAESRLRLVDGSRVCRRPGGDRCLSLIFHSGFVLFSAQELDLRLLRLLSVSRRRPRRSRGSGGSCSVLVSWSLCWLGWASGSSARFPA